jgi:hypothetical protein
MPSRKPAAKRSPARRRKTSVRTEAATSPIDEAITYSALPLHELFQQQTRQMLDDADLDEEQKQSILIAMSCPCCGAGGMSFTAKLKR